MALIQAIPSSQSVFLCTADKLQCWPILARNDTCWLMLAFSFLHISVIGTIASEFYQVFSSENTLWLALGKSWPLLAQPQKKTRVHKGIRLWYRRELRRPCDRQWQEGRCVSPGSSVSPSRGKAFLSKPAEITFPKTRI